MEEEKKKKEMQAPEPLLCQPREGFGGLSQPTL